MKTRTALALGTIVLCLAIAAVVTAVLMPPAAGDGAHADAGSTKKRQHDDDGLYIDDAGYAAEGATAKPTTADPLVNGGDGDAAEAGSDANDTARGDNDDRRNGPMPGASIDGRGNDGTPGVVVENGTTAGDAGGTSRNTGALGVAGTNTSRLAASATERSFRRFSVPRELFRARTITPPTDSVKPLGEVPEQFGLFGSYTAPQLHPESGKIELAQPPLWIAFPRAFTRVDETIAFANRSQFGVGNAVPDQFMVMWDGYLRVTEPGEYAFFVGHDGDIRLFIDGQRVFRDNDSGIYLELFFKVNLIEGEHPFQITYFHRQKEPQLRLRYYTPTDLAVLQIADTYPPEGTTYTTLGGETMETIAEETYGAAGLADVIMEANPGVAEAIDDPLDPDLTLTLPPPPPERVPGEPTIVPREFFRPAIDPTLIPPVIHSLDPPEGGIGDIVRISGQFDAVAGGAPVVEFAGAPANIVAFDPSIITVEVPIGAQTGTVTVTFGTMRSNAAPFTVTTAFGLLASYYNLAGEPVAYVEPGTLVPDDMHITTTVLFTDRGQIDSLVTGGTDPFAIRYEGDLGIAHTGTYTIRAVADENVRLTLDGHELLDVRTPAGSASTTRFLEAGRHPILLETADGGGAASLQIFLQFFPEGGGYAEPAEWLVPPHLFFAPPMPELPPVIARTFHMSPYGPAETEVLVLYCTGLVGAAQENVQVFIDGVPATIEVWDAQGEIITPTESFMAELPDEGELAIAVSVPVGVGDGQVIVRRTQLNSAPVTVPIRNVGLFGVYYDFPEADIPGDWPEGFPEAFAITFMRRDPVISMEGTGEFDLPFVTETFGAVWTGFLRVETAGLYKIWLGGDDSYQLRIDGEIVLDDASIHYFREKSVERELTPGLLPIEIRFLENRRHEVVRLSWQPPGGAKQVVPARHLRMPAEWVDQYEQFLSGGSVEQPGE